MTEHSWFGPASQASQQCSQDLHTMFPLLPPSSAFYENSQDEYPADGPHNVSSRTMTARTVTMSQPPPVGHAIARAESPRHRRDVCGSLSPQKNTQAIALSYAQGPGAWGANEIIMPDGARFSMLEADPMKLTYY